MANILLIDDNDLVLFALRQALMRGNHTVLEAATARHGLILFETENVDLTILDLVMPQGDGLSTLTKIRESDPRHSVIAMSAYTRLGGTDLFEVAMDLGACCILRKPCDVEELLQLVERC